MANVENIEIQNQDRISKSQLKSLSQRSFYRTNFPTRNVMENKCKLHLISHTSSIYTPHSMLLSFEIQAEKW